MARSSLERLLKAGQKVIVPVDGGGRGELALLNVGRRISFAVA